MTAQIRDYNPSTDADAVSEFYNRNHYGPARDASALTGFQLNLVLAERGVHLFLVAEDRGRIVGTIGYLRVSGRRVTRDDELFAGMFVIDPGYRAGFLAGRLFTSSFSRLLEDGITTLRVEVNPANAKAFPLYIRVGFRSADAHPQPDQDGYVELVSHLPGVVSGLLRDLASDVPLGDVFASFSWRTMAGGRNRSIGHGVTTHHDGHVVVDYDFSVRGESIHVTVRMEDGAHVETTINGVVTESPAARTGERAAPLRPGAGRQASLGDYTIELDADGTVSVRHPSYFGPLYRDALPSIVGRPQAWRRPLSHRPLITEHRGGWLLAWQVDGVRLQKQISIGGDTITTEVRSDPGHGLVAEPWSSIRGGVVRSLVGGAEKFRTPNVPGLCPRDVVDFEGSHAAQPFVAHRRTVIDRRDSGVRLQFEWQEAELLRMEGQLLGRATTSGSALRYSLTVEVADSGSAVHDDTDCPWPTPDGIDWLPEPARAESALAGSAPAGLASARLGPGSFASEKWATEIRGGHATTTARANPASELVIAPERGIASWRVDGADVLATPFPSTRTLGPLENWNAGLWVSTQGGREDFEHGVGWGGAARVAYGAAPAEGVPSWSVDIADESISRFRLQLRGDEGASATEIVAHLTPKVWGPAVSIAAHPGWWRLERAARRWSSFARAARIPLAADRVLTITADAVGDELLIRSSADSFVVSLISRAKPAGSSWLLAVETSEAAR